MNEQLNPIKSFLIDHTRLKEGLYISRIDMVEGQAIYTYDLRVIQPNNGAMDGASAHTIEHFMATYLRNHCDGILYVGVMGCLTGFYIVCTEPDPLKMKKNIILTMSFIQEYNGNIVGASEKECGNYKFHNLNGAKEIASKYKEILLNTNRYNYD